MPDPITTEDLYGTSGDQAPSEQAPQPAAPAKPLQYEETPEVPMSGEAGSRSAGPTPPPPAPKSGEAGSRSAGKKSGCLGTIFTSIIFLALFIAGIWVSSFVRQFLPSSSPVSEERETFPSPTVASQTGMTATGSAVVAAWKTYDVISGTTKQSFAGITFQLPPDVLSPICDGTGCASQGTYLPGGTRFTVAPRGAGQVLADFRGSVVSDVGGTAFTTKTTTVVGRPATEFTGTFTGRTVSGYGFSKMRGVMIELTPTTSLEVNHFTPSGIVADFVADDTLFDAILKTIKIAGPTPTFAPTSTPSATTSGY